jgi:hypothetical protein
VREKLSVFLTCLFTAQLAWAADAVCTSTSGDPAVNPPAIVQMLDQMPIKFSYVDSLENMNLSWNGDVPFTNQVIARSGVSSLQGLDTIPVVSGGSALASLGSQYSDLYKTNRPAYNAMEKSFKTGYFAAINDAESKIAAAAGTDRVSVEQKVGAQYVEALTVFDPSKPGSLPKAMIFGGSICTHADGRVAMGGMQVATAPACSDGTMAEVFTVYSLEFDPVGHHLSITMKSAGMQVVAPGASPQVQVGNALSSLK